MNLVSHHGDMGSLTRRQNWTFLTNHARVLVTIARDPAVRLRDVAVACALTERTVQTIVADLESDGYLQRVRDGRRNRYEISAGAVFKHPVEAGVQVAGLLALLTGVPSADPAAEVTRDTAGEVPDGATADVTDATPEPAAPGGPDEAAASAAAGVLTPAADPVTASAPGPTVAPAPTVPPAPDAGPDLAAAPDPAVGRATGVEPGPAVAHTADGAPA